MAITATFGADFSGFISETKKAEASLSALEGEGQQLAKTFTASQSNADRFRNSLQQFDGVLASLGVNIGTEIRGLTELGAAAGKSGEELGLLTTAGLAAGAALGGWKLGRLIADLFSLDAAIGNTTAKLIGWGDLAGETAAAKQDAINAAIRRGADVHITYAEAIAFTTAKAKEEAAAFAKMGEVQRQHAAEMAKIAAEEARWALILAELDSAGGHWSETLKGINGEVVEAVKFYLEAGVSQATLATAYGLTATQIKAVSSALADQLAGAKILAEFHRDAAERQKEIQAAMLRATNDQVLAEFNLQQQKKKADADFLAGALADAQAQDAVNLSMGRAAAAAGATAIAVNGLTSSYWAAVDAAAALAGIPDIGHRPPSITDPGFASPTITGGGLHPLSGVHPLRATGGPVTRGQGYVVGERGPELFVPGSSGAITPNAGHTINIYVNGTAQEVARKVAAELQRTIMAGAKVSAS